jgi:hypothetical protein
VRNLRKTMAAGALTALLVAACTSNDPDDGTAGDAGTGEAGGDLADIEGAAPGVTDSTIRIGVNYVDATALRSSGIELDLGDFERAYQAVADDINADGIDGRTLELVFSPISPADPTATEAECTRLTEDEDVFLVTGFFLGEAVMCPLELHDTAVVGGEQSPALLDRARAPWVTPLIDTDFPATVVRNLADEGLLDGTVAIFTNARSQQDLDAVSAALDDLDITVAETGIVDAPADDVPAIASDVQVLEQRFEAAGVDTVLLVGASAQDWPTYKVNPDYNPQIVSSSLVALQSFTSNEATADTSVIDGAVAGGVYGPNQAIFDAMSDCVEVIEATGLDLPSPDEAAATRSQAFQSAFFPCTHLALVEAWLDAAGPNLNYGTLAAAVEAGFDVQLPGDVNPRSYGPAPASDGDPAAYLYTWDEADGAFTRAD